MQVSFEYNKPIWVAFQVVLSGEWTLESD